MRDKSWEGIERLYENKEISEEQYNSFVAIRSLTDEEWDEIVKDYQKGNINKEQFEQMQQIREMKDDWTTLENGIKGMVYGAVNGVWEGIQWYLGGKLGTATISQSKAVASAVRIGVDAGFNAGDTPFRALMDALLSDKSIKESWQEQGGWQSVLINTAIGLIGSAGGEVFDGLKTKKTNIVSNADTDINVSYLAEDVINSTVAIQKIRSITTNYDVDKAINNAIEETLTKQGLPMTFENIQALRTRVENGDFSFITRTNGARDTIKALKVIDDAIKETLTKQGLPITPENIRKLRIDINYGKFNSITRTNGARDAIKELFKNDAIKYADKYFNIQDKMNIAKSLMIEFTKNNSMIPIGEARIQEAFEKIHACDTQKEFEEIAKHFFKEEQLPLAFWTKNKIFLRPSNSIETIIHEMNHDLGYIRNQLGRNRGIDEAFTESLALKIAGEMGNGHSAYGKNVEYLKDIMNLLEHAGYKEDLLELAYYRRNRSFANVLNDIMEDKKFYSNLAKAMDIADGCGKITDRVSIKDAEFYIENLIAQLKQKLRKG